MATLLEALSFQKSIQVTGLILHRSSFSEGQTAQLDKRLFRQLGNRSVAGTPNVDFIYLLV